MFFKKYKPLDYWSKRGKKYKDDFIHNEFFKIQENTLLDHLKTIQFESVLEFGCGFGRITDLILKNFEIRQYKAFDLSQDQINNAKKLCNNYNVEFEVSTIEDYVDTKKYDLVIGVEILMHVPPEMIISAIENLSKFSNKHMINIDFYEDISITKLAKHNFLHQYGSIYNQLENIQKVNRIKINDKQSLFHTHF